MKTTLYKIQFFLIAALLHLSILIALFWLSRHSTDLLSQNALWKGGDIAYINLGTLSQTSGDTATQNPNLSTHNITHEPVFNKTLTSKSSSNTQIDSPTTNGGNLMAGGGLDSVGPTSPSTKALIRKKIEQNKIIPTDADAQPLSGTVKVGFAINANGQIEELVILKSSGVVAIDQAALKSIQRAVPLPYFKNPIAIDLEYQ